MRLDPGVLLVVGLVVSSACSSVARIQRKSGGFEFQELLGSQIGVASAKVGDGARYSGISAHAYGGGDFVAGSWGMGLRGGLGGDSGKGTGVDLRFGGYPISAHVVYATPPGGWEKPRWLWLYGGLGYMLGGNLKQPGAQTGISVDGYLLYAGARVMVIPFSERVTYNLFVELGNTSSFETEIGAFSSRAIRFGSLLTF